MADIYRCTECNKLIGVIMPNGNLKLECGAVIQLAMYCNCGQYFEWEKRNVSKFLSKDAHERK